jgi:hypothetical protein
MTPEAALMKLSYVLGRNDWSLAEKRAASDAFYRKLLVLGTILLFVMGIY